MFLCTCVVIYENKYAVWRRHFQDAALATRLTFGLLLSRLGIIQANLASPIAAPSARNREGISRLRADRPASLLLWSYYKA